MEKKEILKKMIEDNDKQIQQNRNKRALITYLFFSACFIVVYYLKENPKNFTDYINILIAALFTGGLHFYINSIIFSTLMTKSNNEDKYLENLKKQYNELNK